MFIQESEVGNEVTKLLPEMAHIQFIQETVQTVPLTEEEPTLGDTELFQELVINPVSETPWCECSLKKAEGDTLFGTITLPEDSDLRSLENIYDRVQLWNLEHPSHPCEIHTYRRFFYDETGKKWTGFFIKRLKELSESLEPFEIEDVCRVVQDKDPSAYLAF